MKRVNVNEKVMEVTVGRLHIDIEKQDYFTLSVDGGKSYDLKVEGGVPVIVYPKVVEAKPVEPKTEIVNGEEKEVIAPENMKYFELKQYAVHIGVQAKNNIGKEELLSLVKEKLTQTQSTNS